MRFFFWSHKKKKNIKKKEKNPVSTVGWRVPGRKGSRRQGRQGAGRAGKAMAGQAMAGAGGGGGSGCTGKKSVYSKVYNTNKIQIYLWDIGQSLLLAKSFLLASPSSLLPRAIF